ncbi:outer membrane protein assembly factor BamC [Endozoicomonas sp. OPT23]|uniref:outer membrane protein assembly factor BamC n=1 Tax=Endozoicomonas sp. OPT23 TaxID=2072845 RepID=UPI001891CFB4|nr:outer membrane protein assembly factor BamC [Endozoicomonas sp. OPT23]
MSRVMKTLPVMACALVLVGCSNPFGKQGYFRDKSGDYTQARVTESLVIPKELNTQPMGDSLVIPAISASHDNLSGDFEVPRPDQRLSQEEGQDLSIERQGADRWLFISGSTPGEVWSQIQDFVGAKQLPVAIQDIQQGYLETDWKNLGKDSEQGFFARNVNKLLGAEVTGPMEDRFLIEVRQGVQPDSAEVHLKHKGRPLAKGVQAEPEQWNNMPERSNQLDDAVLSELMLFIAESGKEKSVSLLAQDLNLGELAVLEQDGAGNPQLRLSNLSFARSWSAVEAALKESGFNIMDRNRSAGLFYLSSDVNAKKKESKGFFSGWFGGDDKADDEKGSESTEELRVRVAEQSGAVRVSVEKDANTSAPSETSLKLLNQLKENLK